MTYTVPIDLQNDRPLLKLLAVIDPADAQELLHIDLFPNHTHKEEQ